VTNNANGKVTSKFAAVLAATKSVPDAEIQEELSTPQKPVKTAAISKQRIEAEDGSSRRVGRPNAKRSDPDFVQTTAYIRKDTHRDVKIALLHEGQEQEFSELVEELLSNWLKSNI